MRFCALRKTTPEHVLAPAELVEDGDVVRLERLALEVEQRRPVVALGHDPVETELALLVGHLEEQQVGELLEVVAVRQPVVPEDVAVVPQLVDDHLSAAHDAFTFRVRLVGGAATRSVRIRSSNTDAGSSPGS